MILNSLFLLLAVVVATPLIVVGTECLVALFFDTRSSPCPEALVESVTYKILMPAHNEADIIEKTLNGLTAELPDGNPKNIVLIADNCSDNTASLARAIGVTVLERHDTEKRGKGYALDFGIRHLTENGPPDILLIIDADCESDKASLTNLINTTAILRRPAQMVNLMRVVKDPSIKQKISGFAWLIKNKIRLLAMNKLGLPVTLSTGMAMPWETLEHIHLGSGNLVEDMQLGIDCALAGYPPVFCSEAYLYSDFPEQASAELSQRTRWEHGHLQTIVQQLPRIFATAIKTRDWRLALLGLDVGVPPLALQVLISISVLAFLGISGLVIGNHTPFVLLFLAFSYFTLMLGGIWYRDGQSYLSAQELAAIPQYIASKLSIYSGFLRKRQQEWVRTERDSLK